MPPTWVPLQGRRGLWLLAVTRSDVAELATDLALRTRTRDSFETARLQLVRLGDACQLTIASIEQRKEHQ